MAAQYASEHGKLVRAIVNKGTKDSALKQAFIEEFFAPVQLDLLTQFESGRAHELASYCYEHSKTRKPDTPIIHIAEETLFIDGVESHRVRLVIANDDMPFLVDSISIVLNKLHLKTHIILHPVLQLKRNQQHIISAVANKESRAESYIYIELAPFPKGTTKTMLHDALAQVLKTVRICVEDWHKMEDAIEDVLARSDVAPGGLVGDEAQEIKDFIRWLHNRNFVFLGHGTYLVDGKKPGASKAGAKKSKATNGVVLRQDPSKSLGLYRLKDQDETAIEYQNFTIGEDAITITKANTTSMVHRPAHMDLVVIKHFERDGSVRGETRFLGLFTSNVYYQSAIEIPIIRQKIGAVLLRAGYKPTGHSGKALRTIFEFLPRDEVFLMGEETLFEIGMGVLSAESYPQVRLFIRQDPFKRHVSALVYIPRERFSSTIREAITAMLQAQLGASLHAFYTQISDSPLARLQVVLDTHGKEISCDMSALENTITALVNNWADGLRAVLIKQDSQSEGEALAARYADAFPNSYIYNHDTVSASHDIHKIEACLQGGSGLELELFRAKHEHGQRNALHLKCFTRDMDAALSEVFPLLENMGLNVRDVVPYTITPAGAESVLLRDFSLTLTNDSPLVLAEEKARIEEAMHRIWCGEAANDSMNALLFLTKMDWRDIAMLRGYVRYLQQINFPYRLGYMSRVLAKHPAVTSLIVSFFHTKFTPGAAKREAKLAGLRTEILNHCEQITNLAEDRVLRRILALMEATLRTNFFIMNEKGEPKPYISYKFASGQIPELPLPKPYAEIFVTSGQMEGIHLRGDKVARGGLRWSDRAEDFRTEILGLVKAQMVKNAVIVPEGAKGGFVLRRPPAEREALQQEGIACYKQFLCGLLDITDNIVDGKIIPPAQVVRHDGDDPYLVVAADKGTATFSDIANKVAADYQFWLGDAFASGGSAGYDHKVMGITARGAWVSVERHFAEMGYNIKKDPFTAVGIGDMAGDVFGNGMLLSKNLKLIAAFNHRHIFVDPTPDPAISYKERQRLFKLPRSAWSDYDAQKISKGGGVFERSAKSIALTKEMRDALKTEATHLAPDELIRVILQAPVDLLWNGGIGTYVKASDETHEQVGDRSNNAVRINGKELRAKIVGEGGNLGMTQRGRIEYARHNGRLNTDAIDNSAGVDCSDHEVNIKIALNAAMGKRKLSIKARNELLKEMTDDVASLVLHDNRLQTQAISIAEHHGVSQLEPITQLMRQLEENGFLDRAVEFLPDDKQLEELRAQKTGLSRPELSVMLAYSKLALYRQLKTEKALDSAYFNHDLLRYFPAIFQEKFEKDILAHPLKREIIATMITNSIINRTGITFAHELVRETGLDSIDIALSYVAVRDMFGLRDTWQQIEALGGDTMAEVQMQLFNRVNLFIAHHCRWLLAHYGDDMDIAKITKRFTAFITKLEAIIEKTLNNTLAKSFKTQCDNHITQGVPKALAVRIAKMEAMRSALDIIEIAEESGRDLEQVARLYFEMGSRLRLGWIRQLARIIPVETYWQRQAVTTLKNELYAAQHRITSYTLKCFAKKPANDCLIQWEKQHREALSRYQRFTNELELLTNPDFATLTIALKQVRRITG